jgi:hypothetical protein
MPLELIEERLHGIHALKIDVRLMVPATLAFRELEPAFRKFVAGTRTA